MKRFIMIGCSLLLALLLAGCAGGANEDRGKIAVTYGVLKLVEQSDEIDGDRVLSAVERVRTAVDTTEAVQVSDLTEVVMDRLDLANLSPADQFLVQSIIGQVGDGLVVDVETGVLPEDYTAQLSVWLDWIEGAAYMAGAGR